MYRNTLHNKCKSYVLEIDFHVFKSFWLFMFRSHSYTTISFPIFRQSIILFSFFFYNWMIDFPILASQNYLFCFDFIEVIVFYVYLKSTHSTIGQWKQKQKKNTQKIAFIKSNQCRNLFIFYEFITFSNDVIWFKTRDLLQSNETWSK